MVTKILPMKVYNPDRGNGSEIKNSKVFIYWPHGFGDWVFLSYVLPHLEPSNQYWISRFGDDNTSVFEGSKSVTPVYMGINRCTDGNEDGNHHFGLHHHQLDGSIRLLNLPLSLYEEFYKNGVDTMLWSGFPETHGYDPYPFHSKGRKFLHSMVPDTKASLSFPLKSCISTDVPSWVQKWVDSRIYNVTGSFNKKICVIGRTGYTSTGKNWGHKFRENLPLNRQYEAAEPFEFICNLRLRDPNWVFVTMDEGELKTLCHDMSDVVSYYDVFGEIGKIGIPFGLALRGLFQRTNLFIGVPAGPYHLSMIYRDFPTIGLWIEHFPSWYDEPKTNSIHLAGQQMRDAQYRPGTFETKEVLHFRTKWLDTPHIPANAVMDALDELQIS